MTNAGAFSTMRAIFQAFSDVPMEKITYDVDKTDRHMSTRDKFYARELKKLGYEEVNPPETSWEGQRRFWVKRGVKSRALEKIVAVTAIVAIALGTALILPTITGLVTIEIIGNQTSLIGKVSMVVGFIAVLIWLRIRKIFNHFRTI
jgi:hypothetical protein